ncbi:MAG: adenine phosphoribosyltransferase [Hadesarchaea archaeon]|nr:adenine phosphoribosyltransferase [Hadesarchaea archaeon]
MKRKTQLDSIKQRMEAVDLLRLMKAKYKYDELSSKTKLPVVVLNRYIRGRVLPSAKRARWLIKFLGSEFNVKNELRNRIEFDEEGYLDNTRILGDVLFVKKIANMAKGMFGEITVDKVITAAVDGISIAVPIAQEFKSDLVIAKKEREVGVGDLIEETYVPSFSGVVMSLYIPSRAIHKRENILIVDDIIRSGETPSADKAGEKEKSQGYWNLCLDSNG